jgi:hypothetical protein
VRRGARVDASASKTDFSLPRPTLQVIRPVTNKAREPSRGKPQSAAFSHAAPEAGMFCALRGEVAATGAVVSRRV